MDLVKFPDPILAQVSKPVEDLTPDQIEVELDVLTEEMSRHNGIGLSSIQLGSALRMFTVLKENLSVMGFVNPRILAHTEATVDSEEECLSIPGFRAVVKRYEIIEVENFGGYEDYRHTRTLSGRDAIVFQHELDHLNGITLMHHVMKQETVDE